MWRSTKWLATLKTVGSWIDFICPMRGNVKAKPVQDQQLALLSHDFKHPNISGTYEASQP
jgi:hypothetical protein